MEKEQIFQRNAGFFAFFLSGICAISSGVVVSILQEIYGFAYGMTGTLLSLMSIGNLLAMPSVVRIHLRPFKMLVDKTF